MAKNSKEYELAIKIAGQIEKSFTNSTKLTRKELQDIAKQASMTSNGLSNSFGKGFDDLDKGFSKVSKAATKTFGVVKDTAEITAAAIATVTAASTVAGMSFESSFAGVKKTTDATAGEYAKIREGIIDMSKDIPATADNISEVAEVAGQLGIEKDNLLDFTRVMIDLGESTNLTATEGASDLAKFANITQMAADKYSNLGSTIVALGNNFATTESDIVSMATRLAASGELTGLSESQIMAVSTAMSSLGIEAESGGSSMSKLLKMIQVAVETGNGSLKQFSSVANMSTKQFQKAFKEDAVGALAAFVDGLNDTKRNGKSATVILDNMGMTEVRLSNTILSLANSNGLMTKAVDMANEAWDENTALSKEAAQRYATNESKLKMFRNSMTGLGIQLYDEYSEPLGDAIDAGSDFVKNLADNVVPNLIDAFHEKLPTVIRNTKEFTSSFIEFAEPVISLGKWLIQNPDIIVSTLVGIGSALAAYKIASGIRSLTKVFSALGLVLTNPFAMAITGVALAIGGAAGIAAYIKQANKEMKKQNLAEHFGNISLSLNDLKDVASSIIKSDSLGKLTEAMGAMDDMENMAGSIKRAVKDLNRMNWKVGIGMELTDEEKQAYQSNIVSYIADVQDLIAQKQYAVTLSVEVLMGSDLENSNVIKQINDFYADKQQELAALGTKLNETVTEAFQDGLLDIDEVKEITELQSQMAKIQSAVAGSQFDAQLELLNLKYSGADLDPETFKNLQAEIGEQVQKAVADYDESLTLGIANAKVMFEDGAITQKEYDSMVKQLKEGYLDQIGDIELKAMNFQLGTIMDQYSDELETAMPGFEKVVNEALQGSTDYINSGLDNMVLNFDVLFSDVEGYSGLNKATKLAIKDLFEQLNPTVEQINQLKEKYREYGVGIPESIIDGLNDASKIGALADDYNSIWTVLGNAAANSEEHTKAIEAVKEKGWYVPEELANAINDNKSAVDDSITGLYSYTQGSISRLFSSGINVSLPVSLNPKVNNAKIQDGWAAYANPSTLGGHADGGIFNTPHIAWFAEKGPEAAIPLDGSSDAIDLWRTAGKLLGVYTQGKSGESFASFSDNKDDSFGSLLGKIDSPKKKSNTSGEQGKITISYSPNYNFYGGPPTKDEMVEAARVSQEEFDQKMDQWIRAKGRKQFA